MMFLAGGGFSILMPSFGHIFWATVAFVIFWAIMSKVAFKPITEALLERENEIQSSLDEAKSAREEMAQLKSEHENLLAQAREERSKILKEAKAAGENIVVVAKDKAKVEANRIVTSAKEQIENEKMAAMIDIKNTSGKMALDIAEKVIQKELANSKEHQSFVQKLVSEINLS